MNFAKAETLLKAIALQNSSVIAENLSPKGFLNAWFDFPRYSAKNIKKFRRAADFVLASVRTRECTSVLDRCHHHAVRAKYAVLMIFFGGPEGSRTPVRKTLGITFFVDSRFFIFPSFERQSTDFQMTVTLFCMIGSSVTTDARLLLFDAHYKTAVLLIGTGGVKPRHCRQAAIATFLVSLIIYFDRLSGSVSLPRLLYLTFPVETITGPYVSVIFLFLSIQ